MIKRKHSAQTFILVKSKYFIFRKMPNTIYFSADWIYLSASFDSFQTFIDGTNWNFVILNMQASLSSNSSPVSEKKHQALSYKKKKKKKKRMEEFCCINDQNTNTFLALHFLSLLSLWRNWHLAR